MAQYHVRVEAAERQMAELVQGEDEYMEVFQRPASDLECVQYSAGNPRVEHITGLVHLYKQTEALPAPSEGTPSASYASALQNKPAAAPSGASATLCCLALPADMSVAQFCTFIGAYLAEVSSLQVLRREGTQPSLCMVLLTFAQRQKADEFYKDFNGIPFSSLEPEILCRLVYVREVEVLSNNSPTPTNAATTPNADAAPAPAPAATATSPAAGAASSPADKCSTAPSPAAAAAALLAPPAGYTELPTCPVCLERLDEHVSGVVTTVCNHIFHGECLKRWGDTSCPVCRYCMYSNSSGSTSRCATCGTTSNLWICLICGHVGCGRYKSGHANHHWQQSSHCYALELETQRVWDYAGDGYVHRLIQSKTDGKLVEVPSPAPAACRHRTPHSSRGGACDHDPGSRRRTEDQEDGEGCPHCQDEQQVKDALLASKLDAISWEYNHLLTSQLDSQRQYFEARLQEAGAAADRQLAAAKEAAAAAERKAAAAEAEAREADRRRQQLERKLGDASASSSKLESDCQFLRSLNETLLANQKQFQGQVGGLQQQLAEKEAEVKDLQEQVRDLMVFIEAGRTIQESGTELKDATLLPVPAKPGKPQRRGSRK